MTIKEMPLIKATSRLGAHPKFLFVSPFFTGVVGAFMVAIFGATAAMFLMGFMASNGVELFTSLVQGIGVTLGLAAVIFLAQIARVLSNWDEDSAQHLQVACGGLTGIIIIVGLLFLVWHLFGDALEYWGPVVPGWGDQ